VITLALAILLTMIVLLLLGFPMKVSLLGGALVAAAGVFLIGRLALQWAASGFGPLESSVTLRPMVFGSTLVAIGIQTVLMSFVCSMFGIQRRRG